MLTIYALVKNGVSAPDTEVLRARLVEAGVTRAELHTRNADRIALRAHDLRGSFVTVALANGRSESWVSDRTGL